MKFIDDTHKIKMKTNKHLHTFCSHSRFAEAEGKRHLEELLDHRKNLMERLRKLEASKSKGLRSQGGEGEDVDAAITKINGDIELTNVQVPRLPTKNVGKM